MQHSGAMRDSEIQLRYQPEHYLAVLTGLSQANWLALVLLVGIFIATGGWPSNPSMCVLFGAVGAGFIVANLLLSLCLKYRGWLQKAPRSALNRLRQLTAVVLFWDAIHVLGLFDLFGGLQGPFAALLPVLVVISFNMLPRKSAILASGLLIFGVVTLLGLEELGVLIPLHAVIDESQAAALQSSRAFALVLAAISIASLFITYRQVDGVNIHNRGPKDLCDPRFNCFSLACWHARLGSELIRGHAQKSTTSVVTVGLKSADVASDFDAVNVQLRLLAAAALNSTRQDLDTLSYIGNLQFALLLPTATQDKCDEVVARIQQQFPAAELRASSSVSPQAPREGLLKSLLVELEIPPATGL